MKTSKARELTQFHKTVKTTRVASNALRVCKSKIGGQAALCFLKMASSVYFPASLALARDLLSEQRDQYRY